MENDIYAGGNGGGGGDASVAVQQKGNHNQQLLSSNGAISRNIDASGGIQSHLNKSTFASS